MKLRILAILFFFIINPEAEAQSDTLKQEDQTIPAGNNYLSLGHVFSHFNKDLHPWNTSALESKVNASDWVFVSRVNLSRRFELNGWSVEQDVYRKFLNKDYAYLHAGYSPSPVFFKFSFAGEYFNAFAGEWEQSLGARSMIFQDTLSVLIATASLSKYTGRFLSILRASMGYQNFSTLSVLNASFQQRYYHGDESYTSLLVSYGYDPNAILFSNKQDLASARNTSFNIGLNTMQKLSNRWGLQGQVEYLWYDFGTVQRSQYTYSLKLFYYW